MSEVRDKTHVYLTRGEQSKIKPKIEDVIPEVMDGVTRDTALNFVAYLQENGMPLKWASLYGWDAFHKGKSICGIRLNVEDSQQWCGRPGVPPSWIVLPRCDHMSQYEDEIVSEGLQGIFWDGVGYCVHSPESGFFGKNCRPDSVCAGGRSVTLIGRDFYGICKYHAHPKVWDPGEAEIIRIIRLLALERNARDGAVIPNLNLLNDSYRRAVLEFIDSIKMSQLSFSNGVCKLKSKNVANVEVNVKGELSVTVYAQFDSHFAEALSQESDKTQDYMMSHIYLRNAPLLSDAPCGGCTPGAERRTANEQNRNICAFISVRMINPDIELLGFAEKLVALRRDAILSGRVPKCNYIKPADRI